MATEAPGSKFELGRLIEDLKEVTNWFQLGLRLGIKHADLTKIELDHRHEGTERCKTEMIVFWRKNIRNATLRKLTTALEEVGLRNLAERVREKYNVPLTDNIDRHIVTQVMEPDELLNPSSDYSKQLDTKCIVDQLDEEVRLEYARFANELQKLLERKGVSVDDAIFNFAHLSKSDITSDMREAANIQAFLLALKDTQSWYNFHTTASLAELLGEDEGKKLVKKYEAKLKVHLKKRRKAIKIKTRQFAVKIDLEQEQLTKEKLVKFRNTITRVMNLNYDNLLLRSIKDGCVELTYLLASTHDISEIKSAIGEHSSELKKERVISVSIDGDIVWPKAEQSGALKGEVMITESNGLKDVHAIGSKTNIPPPLKYRSATASIGIHGHKSKQPCHKLILTICRNGLMKRKQLIITAAIVLLLLMIIFSHIMLPISLF